MSKLTYTKFKEQLLTEGVGVGTMVKLKKPINGMAYGTVKGFDLDPKIDGPRDPRNPLIGAKVLSLRVTLKKSPLFTGKDYGDTISLKDSDFVVLSNLDVEREVAAYRKQGASAADPLAEWSAYKKPDGILVYLKVWQSKEAQANGVVPKSVSIRSTASGFKMGDAEYKDIASLSAQVKKLHGVDIDKAIQKKLSK